MTLNLQDYDITAARGFLTPHDMGAAELPDVFADITEAGDNLSALMSSGRLRHFLDQLPEIDMDAELPKLNDAQLRLLMVRYSFIVQAYVWGEEHPPKHLPRNIAVPYCKLSEVIGQYR